MTCPHLPAEDLVAWLDRELASPDEGRVAAHVAACTVCAREADLLRRSGDLLGRLPGAAPSAGFADRVTAAAVRGTGAVRATGASSDTSTPRGRVVAFPRWAGAAAAVLVVAAGAWWMARPDDPTRLSARDEEEIARDLLVLTHLDVLTAAEAEELASIADDLDVIDTVADAERENGG